MVAAKTRPPDTRPKRWTPLELVAADIPEPECFWGGIVARQTICLVAGRRSAGKTYFSLAWAASIAIGKQFGYLPTGRGKVLYLSQEMTEPAIRRRLTKLFTINQLRELADNLIIVCREKINLTTPEGADYLAGIVKEVGADVVFIDALRDIKGSFKENSNDEMGILMVALRDRVAAETNSAVVLIHHKGKPQKDAPDGGGRGASVIEDVSADVIYLTSVKGNPIRKGEFAKTRDGELEGQEFNYDMVDDDDTGKIVVSMSASVEDANEDQDFLRAEKLVAILADNPDMTKEEIQRRMSWTPETTRLAIRAGRKAKMIESTGGGGRGNRALFRASKRWEK